MTNPAAKLAPPLTSDALLNSTPKEAVQRAMTLTCTLPKGNKPSCSGAVFLGLFFDGTGNNRDADLPEHKQSNVVRFLLPQRIHTRCRHAVPDSRRDAKHRLESPAGQGRRLWRGSAYLLGTDTSHQCNASVCNEG
jgi:hypothetical protein